MSEEGGADEDSRQLVLAIISFLSSQISNNPDSHPENHDSIRTAIQCLQMTYRVDMNDYARSLCPTPLLDIFKQVIHPVSVKDKLEAEQHKERGNSLMRRKMYSNAEKAYSDAIQRDKWNAIYYCNRAGAKIEQGNFLDAIVDCRHALALNPDYAEAHSRMGQAYALLNKPREAATCLHQAVKLEPNNEKYRNNLKFAERRISVSQPNAMELFATFLASFEANSNSNIGIVPSFMIIAESQPAASNASENGIGRSNEDFKTLGGGNLTGNSAPISSTNGVTDDSARRRQNVVLANDAQDVAETGHKYMEYMPLLTTVPGAHTESCLGNDASKANEASQDQEAEDHQEPLPEIEKIEISKDEDDASSEENNISGYKRDNSLENGEHVKDSNDDNARETP